MSGMDSAIPHGQHNARRRMYASLVGACVGTSVRTLKFDPDPTKFEYAKATAVERTKAAEESLANCTTERDMLMVAKPFITDLAEQLRTIEPSEKDE